MLLKLVRHPHQRQICFPNVPIGDFCHRRSIKCNKVNGPLAPCQNCADFAIQCTYDRPARRRGARRNASLAGSQAPRPLGSNAGAGSSSSHSVRPDIVRQPGAADSPWDILNGTWTTAPISNDGALVNSWKAFAIGCESTIHNLAHVYFEIVYPMYFILLIHECRDSYTNGFI